ncbi:MAG: hypothetical protein KKC19_04405 [Nanoarchaeota archaeon]|nr:hypothetical protein [Nanoarchaeota archaeon]
MSSFSDLQDRVSASIDIESLTRQVANLLNRFEIEKQPVIYDKESSRKNCLHTQSMMEIALMSLGFLNVVYRGKNVYDYQRHLLNDSAREAWEKLKEEGYYSDSKG